MIPQFPDFKKIELSDKQEIDEFTAGYPPYSDFEFGSLWSWNVKDSVQLSILNENLVVLFTDYTDGQFFYSFLGTNEVTDTADRLLAYAERTDGYLNKLELVPDVSIVEIDTNKFTVEESRDHFDYICDVRKYVTFSGNSLKSQRGMFNVFLREHPEFVVEKLNLSDRRVQREVADLYLRWNENKGFLMLSEAFAYERFLETANNFAYAALGIRIEDKLAAFHISTLPPGTCANALFEKADTRYPGIYQAINHEMAKELLDREYTHMNIEQDLGVENLRKAKLAVRPAYFLKKYTITRK